MDSVSFKEARQEITEGEFLEWKTLPATQSMFKVLRSVRAGLVDGLCNGSTLCGDCGKTGEETAKIVGMLYGIDLFLEARYDETEVKK